MKLSESWLREWVNPDMDLATLLDKLAMAGHETDAVIPVADDFTGVVVAEVLATEKHPNADKLTLCKVNIGQDEPLPIVCGAKNVRAGLKVALATVGAKLPGDFKIKRSKIRGEESLGMICSSVELSLAESSEGIIELPNDAPVGMDFRQYLLLDDVSIDLDLTPNRGDCLSILGIAREVSVITGATLQAIKTPHAATTIQESFPVKVQNPEACPRYVGRLIKNINSQATTPLWMTETLRRSGIRAIHPVVDVTNYVMLELGQPLHAFDVDKLNQEIIVRLAKPKETITLLTGDKVQLAENTLIIADAKKPLAIAGVMGGEDSGVNETTKHVFLESAFFAPEVMSGRARQYGLHTDSSHRFERGVDPQLQKVAIERASELLLAIVGGEAGSICEFESDSYIPKQKKIHVSYEQIKKVLGIDVSREQINEIFAQLHMNITASNGSWEITVPSYRFDLHREIDIIEEIARLYGYQHIPSHEPQVNLPKHKESEKEVSLKRIRQCLIDRDYSECITYSFVEPKLHELIVGDKPALSLENPISPELSIMRRSLWPGLLNTLIYNQNRQQQRIRIFETGLKFVLENGELQQQVVLAGMAAGDRLPMQWGAPERGVDFFDVKSDLEAVLGLTQQQKKFMFIKHEHRALHPGQTAAIKLGDQQVGIMGVLHPKIAHELDIKIPTILFEVDLLALQQGIIPKFKDISKFPAILRDIAIIVDEQITADAITTTIQNVASDWLVDLKIFDVYQGKGIEKHQKSIALSMVLQHQEKTLIDDEVAELMKQVIQALQREYNAVLRD